MVKHDTNIFQAALKLSPYFDDKDEVHVLE